MTQERTETLFASKTVLEHILRGAAGGTLLLVAAWSGADNWLLSGAALLGGFALLRGCPMCWTVGLIETVIARRRSAPWANLLKRSFNTEPRCARCDDTVNLKSTQGGST